MMIVIMNIIIVKPRRIHPRLRHDTTPRQTRVDSGPVKAFKVHVDPTRAAPVTPPADTARAPTHCARDDDGPSLVVQHECERVESVRGVVDARGEHGAYDVRVEVARGARVAVAEDLARADVAAEAVGGVGGAVGEAEWGVVRGVGCGGEGGGGGGA
ncbi:hypothetical protein QJS04_geneDACA011359 [Acorus gramineus]|uniref:Uncharacterized protein n=1 Tax=Acorus gramineus TaxID=55184 RepID=A0AAV9ANH7_ACOGR|nr:hypothetical protein QJS04_geneDACA011359 [Acorus gramineus]